jgi:HAD superfamily hydrolase (TIGR01509 family)
VATSTDRARAVSLLGGAGLAERFERIIGGDMITRGKPDPEIFLTSAQAFGVPPRDCVVLEDSPVGAAAAYAGGMRAILVPDIAAPDKKTLGRVCAVCKDLYAAAEVIRSVR